MTVHYVPARKPTPDILGNVLGGKVGPEEVEIESIQTNGGTQPRAGINEQHVQDLVEAINRGDTLPAVDVYFDGSQYWLYDGFHRVEAHNRCRKSTILANIHQGTQQDAQWASYGANPGHGLKRTNEDKKRAVLAALRHPNAASLSNVQIAAHVHVDEGTIRNYRTQMEASSEIPKIAERTVTRGGVTYTQNVFNIGSNQPQYAEVWRLQHVVQEVFERFYDADELRHACSDMRMAARTRTGGFWVNCERSMPDDIKDYRKSDLSQAINNLAAQKEAKAAGTNSPAGEPTPVAEVIDAELFGAAERAGITDLEPGMMRRPFQWNDKYWVSTGGSYGGDATVEYDYRHCVRVHSDGEPIAPGVRINSYRSDAYVPGTELHYGDGLRSKVWRIGEQWLIVKRRRSLPIDAPAKTQTDEPERRAQPARLGPVAPMPTMLLKGKLRQWLGERYTKQGDSPALHMYQMLDHWLKGAWLYDLEVFTATLPAGWTQAGLDQAISELHAHFAPDPDEQDAPPVQDTDQAPTSLNDLVVVDSVTALADPEPESDLDCYDEESATVAAKRMNKLHTLKVRFGETIGLLDSFGELTGRHTASLLAKRELTNLIEILDTEMDLLQKGRA